MSKDKLLANRPAINRYNSVVMDARRKLGMTLEYPCENCDITRTEECVDKNCARWRAWWIQRWNSNIYRGPVSTPESGRAWRYEHPDLIREGIIWQP